MPQNTKNSFTWDDDVTHRKFVIPMSLDTFNSYSPDVKNRMLDFFINTTLQGEQLNKGLFKRNEYNTFNPTNAPQMTPKLQQSPFNTQPIIGPQQTATGATRTSAPYRFIENMAKPIVANVEGAVTGALSPLQTLGDIPSNAMEFVNQQEQRSSQPGVGPGERAARTIGSGLSPIIGPGAIQAGEAYESGDIPASLGRTAGELAGAVIPGGVGEGVRAGSAAVKDIMGLRTGEKTFNRVIGNPRAPELQSTIARTMPESMEETPILDRFTNKPTGQLKGVTTFGNTIQSAIADTSAMHRFNTQRIEQLTRDIRDLPVKTEPMVRTADEIARVQGQMVLPNPLRVPKGQPGAGRIRPRQQAISADTYALLDSGRQEAVAALQQLPRDSIMNIVNDVHSGVLPSELFKSYFVDMIDQIVEDSVPSAQLSIDPASRRAAGIVNVDGATLMRNLEELSNGSYTTPAGVNVPWNRLDVMADAAGVNARIMKDNLSAVASQLEHLQATGKLGPKVDRINLAMSMPISQTPTGSRGRIFGQSPIVAGAEVGGAAGGAVGGYLGGFPGAALGAGVGMGLGATFPTIVATAAVSPRTMFALRQYLRLSSTAASEFAAAKRLQKVANEELQRIADEAGSQSQVAQPQAAQPQTQPPAAPAPRQEAPIVTAEPVQSGFVPGGGAPNLGRSRSTTGRPSEGGATGTFR